MSFSKALYCLVDCILVAGPKLGPTFLNKMDIAGAYMLIWVRLKNIPSVAFLVPKSSPEEEHFILFHL